MYRKLISFVSKASLEDTYFGTAALGIKCKVVLVWFVMNGKCGNSFLKSLPDGFSLRYY